MKLVSAIVAVAACTAMLSGCSSGGAIARSEAESRAKEYVYAVARGDRELLANLYSLPAERIPPSSVLRRDLFGSIPEDDLADLKVLGVVADDVRSDRPQSTWIVDLSVEVGDRRPLLVEVVIEDGRIVFGQGEE